MLNAPYFASIRRLAEYETWCNTRLLEAAAALSHDQLYQPFSIGFGTVHATLFHTVQVFAAWSTQTQPQPAGPAFTDYDAQATLAHLTAWNQTLAEAWLNAIDQSHAGAVLHQDQRLDRVFHLVTHGTHHRSQCLNMFRRLGIDPPYEPGDFGGWSNPATA